MTKIEWTEAVWNPVTGCTKVSEGCRNCYAERMAKRLAGRFGYPVDKPFQVTLHHERLEEPLRWRKPRTIFVNSMSDLFHPDVPFSFLDRVFAVMAVTPRHTYQVLTKRPGRMLEYFERFEAQSDPTVLGDSHIGQWINGPRNYLLSSMNPKPGGDKNWVWIEPDEEEGRTINPGYWDWCGDGPNMGTHLIDWPLPNVWLGTSVENQKAADERIPHLLQCPAAIRFLSCEPLLGPIDFRKVPGFNRVGLDLSKWWVIAGGESGPGARQMHPDWVRSLMDQCQAARVSFFCKQMGSVWAKENHADSKGGDWDLWPEDLRVREMPNGAR